jgi:DNA-binding transcriptional ArsR family regulator
MRQLLWWLIGGSRGGRNRLRIVRTLDEQPRNTNQLSNDLELNYKTVQHHLEVLEENNIVTTHGNDYGKMYFLTDQMTNNFDVLEEIVAEADLDTAIDTDTDNEGNDNGVRE